MITIIDLREGAIDIDITKLGIFEHKAGSGHIIKKHYFLFENNNKPPCIVIRFIKS